MNTNIPFLQQVAQHVLALRDKVSLADVCVVFPNKRAGFFFQKFLVEEANEPLWSPKMMSLNELTEFIAQTAKPSRIQLLFELYKVYNEQHLKIFGTEQPFDRFYFWGEMLLKDFDEIDKNGINGEKIFGDVSDQKEIDLLFEDFMDDEQKDFLRNFWGTVYPDSPAKPKEYAQHFAKLWQMLAVVHKEFKARLAAKHLCSDGMLFEMAAKKAQQPDFQLPWRAVIFAGFSELSRYEAAIMDAIIAKNPENNHAYWDIDAYYVLDKKQEAGTFARRYIWSGTALGKTFPNPVPAQLVGKKIHIQQIGVPLEAAQGKVVGEILANIPTPDARLNTLVLLPNQHLLFPLLHAIPSEKIGKINVSIGYPIRSTPIYSLLQHLLVLHKTAKQNKDGEWILYYKPVLALLRHPYILYQNNEAATELVRDIEEHNKMYLLEKNIHAKNEALFPYVFWIAETPQQLLDNLLLMLEKLAFFLRTSLNQDKHTIEEEYLYEVYVQVQQLQSGLQDSQIKIDDLQQLWLIIKKITETLTVSFSGEPLEGLQVMGLLESQALDFENLIIPAMNEGQLPPPAPQGSFIPVNIRRAYKLSTPEQHDAQYAYYFYRLLHKAKNVYFVHNTESTGQLKSEVSHFVHQLRIELGYEIQVMTAAAQATPPPTQAIRVSKKDSEVKAKLLRFTQLDSEGKAVKALYPSSLNTFLACSLKFYFQQIAELREPPQVSETIDAAVLGNLLHETMELVYRKHWKTTKQRGVTAQDIDRLKRENAVEKAFIEAFKNNFDGSEDLNEGVNVIIKRIIEKYANKILDIDRDYAPFDIVGLEKDDKSYRHAIEIQTNGEKLSVQMQGKIDRIDQKDRLIRIIDYKTGNEKTAISDMEKLFHPKQEYKAAMQAFFYGLLYYRGQKTENQPTINIGIISTRQIFSEDYDYRLKFGKEMLDGLSEELMEAYETRLTQTLTDIFDEEKPFEQTENVGHCGYCAYKQICHR